MRCLQQCLKADCVGYQEYQYCYIECPSLSRGSLVTRGVLTPLTLVNSIIHVVPESSVFQAWPHPGARLPRQSLLLRLLPRVVRRALSAGISVIPVCLYLLLFCHFGGLRRLPHISPFLHRALQCLSLLFVDLYVIDLLVGGNR